MDNFVTFRVKQGKRESQLTQNLVALYTSFILGTERTEFLQMCCPRRRPSLLWNSRRSRALKARGPAHDLTQCDITDSSDSVSHLKMFFFLNRYFSLSLFNPGLMYSPFFLVLNFRCVPTLPGREQERQRTRGMCGHLGRMQSLLSQLLHEIMGMTF